MQIVEKTRQNITDVIKLLLLFLFCFSNTSFTQESNHKKEYHNLFFEALTQKAIQNYDIAIEKLEHCERLIPNQKAALFEISKNYLKREEFLKAIIYGNKALKLDQNDVWITEHLVNCYQKNHDYNKAISYQKKLIEKQPIKKRKLIYLYLISNNKKAAIKVLEEMIMEKTITPNLKRLKDRITRRNIKRRQQINKVNIDVEKKFNDNKSFSNLKRLLLKLDLTNSSKLLKYSNLGLSLFPAQPFVYLMNAKALNKEKKYKEAIIILNDGLDFIIDDPVMEKQFYGEYVISYSKLGDKKNSKKFSNKLK